MSHLKRLTVVLLHLAAAVFVQLDLLHLLLKESDPTAGVLLLHVLPGAAACLLDLFLSSLLLRRMELRRLAAAAVHFWDLLLIFPVLVLAFFGLLSDGGAAAFASCVFLLDLLLVLERSTLFVLSDPARKK